MAEGEPIAPAEQGQLSGRAETASPAGSLPGLVTTLAVILEKGSVARGVLGQTGLSPEHMVGSESSHREQAGVEPRFAA